MFDKTIAKRHAKDYNTNIERMFYKRSAKTCAVVVRTSVLTETPLH